MFLKKRSSAPSAARHPYRPLCLPPPCLLLWSPFLWSPPTWQVHPPCLSPRSLLQLLRHLPPLCHVLHNPDLTIWILSWPPTASSWYRTTLVNRSSSAKPTTRTSRWFSVTRVLSSRPPSNMPYCPSRAAYSSRPLYRTAPSAGGVLLMTAATQTTRRGLEGRCKEMTVHIMTEKLRLSDVCNPSVRF